MGKSSVNGSRMENHHFLIIGKSSQIIEPNVPWHSQLLNNQWMIHPWPGGQCWNEGSRGSSCLAPQRYPQLSKKWLANYQPKIDLGSGMELAAQWDSYGFDLDHLNQNLNHLGSRGCSNAFYPLSKGAVRNHGFPYFATFHFTCGVLRSYELTFPTT